MSPPTRGIRLMSGAWRADTVVAELSHTISWVCIVLIFVTLNLLHIWHVHFFIQCTFPCAIFAPCFSCHFNLKFLENMTLTKVTCFLRANYHTPLQDLKVSGLSIAPPPQNSQACACDIWRFLRCSGLKWHNVCPIIPSNGTKLQIYKPRSCLVISLAYFLLVKRQELGYLSGTCPRRSRAHTSAPRPWLTLLWRPVSAEKRSESLKNKSHMN